MLAKTEKDALRHPHITFAFTALSPLKQPISLVTSWTIRLMQSLSSEHLYSSNAPSHSTLDSPSSSKALRIRGLALDAILASLTSRRVFCQSLLLLPQTHDTNKQDYSPL